MLCRVMYQELVWLHKSTSHKDHCCAQEGIAKVVFFYCL